MPCNCDYLEPTQYEEESKKMCQHLIHALTRLNRKDEIPQWVIKGAGHIYGVSDKTQELTQWLCKVCSNMTQHEKDYVIYDGYSSKARALADWWEEHQKQDQERIKREKREQQRKQREKEKKKVKKEIKKKLTQEEIKVLGL